MIRESRYSHLANNRKKKYIDEVRYTEIERENRLLLEKIHNIIKKPSDISYRKKKKLVSLRHSSNKQITKKFSERIRQSVRESESRWESRANLYSVMREKKESSVVFNGRKKIGKRIFTIKILEHGEYVKIFVSDSGDTFRLLLRESDIFPEFASRGDWNEVVDCISMESDKLVLVLNRSGISS